MDNNNFSILDLLTEYLTNERFDGIMAGDEGYMETQEEIDGAMAQFDALHLPEEQRAVVDSLVESFITNGTSCMKMAYQQGMRDCAVLLKELGMV